jgi:hypothetical protein
MMATRLWPTSSGGAIGRTREVASLLLVQPLPGTAFPAGKQHDPEFEISTHRPIVAYLLAARWRSGRTRCEGRSATELPPLRRDPGGGATEPTSPLSRAGRPSYGPHMSKLPTLLVLRAAYTTLSPARAHEAARGCGRSGGATAAHGAHIPIRLGSSWRLIEGPPFTAD